MRGAAGLAGKGFKIPKSAKNMVKDLLNEEDYPVPTSLVPINDEWSWSLGAEPADPRDCARYPASPYCGEIPLSKLPVGYEVEIKRNGCETCLYIYPVILFVKATPQVICKRDPNCDIPKPPFNKDEITKYKPKRFDENPQPNQYKSPECAFREKIINAYYNWHNDVIASSLSVSPSDHLYEYRAISVQYVGTIRRSVGTGVIVDNLSLEKHLFQPFPIPNSNLYVYHFIGDLNERIGMVKSFERKAKGMLNADWEEVRVGYNFANWKPICPNAKQRPPILPPPPYPHFNDRPPQNRKPPNKGKDMCCNDCADSKDNTEKLLREIKEIKKTLGTGKLDRLLDVAGGIGDSSLTAIVNLIAKRLGTSSYPIEVPQSLLQGLGDGIKTLDSNAEFLHWLTYQFDSLIGQFPIDIDVKDIDPLKAGDQKKTIQLPNIAEAIAEMYGLTIKSSVNQEVELNMLLRIAAETIATKNAVVVTQDYARANAQFLGYKGNFKPRELQYTFDFANANLDPKSKEPVVLEKLLKTVKGFVQGWENTDKETVMGFLQKLMFSAGIIKAVFFRGKKQQKELQRELRSMADDEKTQEAKFDAFIKEINDPESRFNRDSQDKPIMKDVTPPDSKGAK